MTGVSGLGVWPGTDVLRAQLDLFEDLASAPYGVESFPAFVQLADRGPGADALGRTLALLDGLPTELGLHGWKLASHRGRDLERAQGYLAQDLEALSIAGAGYTGNLTVQLTGPWTLAAKVYLSQGDRMLTDLGAVIELGQALTEATINHLAQVKERVPGAKLTVQLDETLLSQINVGALPTFSGYSRIRAVTGPTLVEVLKPLVTEVKKHAQITIHVGPTYSAIAPVVLSGATGLGMEFTRGNAWHERGWEHLARAQEKGLTLWAGLPATHVSQCSGPNFKELADLVLVGWTRIGLPVKQLSNVVLTQSAQGAQVAAQGGEQLVRGSMATLMRLAEHLAERAAQ